MKIVVSQLRTLLKSNIENDVSFIFYHKIFSGIGAGLTSRRLFLNNFSFSDSIQ